MYGMRRYVTWALLAFAVFYLISPPSLRPALSETP